MKLKLKKRHLLYPTLMLMACGLVLWYIDHTVSTAGDGAIYENVDAVPPKAAALVLGTAKYAYGRENLFYNHRLDAAAELFKAGKVRAIVLSGDNSRVDYDEPTRMKEDLVKRGVPGEYITLDYAGFRTLDSVVRAKEIFGLDDFIIVSQRFHCERALFIAQARGCRTIGYQARSVGGIFGLKVRLREVLARCKAFLDVKVLGTEPKFLGKKEKVNYKGI